MARCQGGRFGGILSVMGRQQGLRPEQERLLELIAKGHTWEFAAEALGVSVRTVARWLADQKVKAYLGDSLGKETLAAAQITNTALRIAQRHAAGQMDSVKTIQRIQEKILKALDEGVDAVIEIL